MTAIEQVNVYLRRLEQRLRLFAASRGAAIVAVLALALTIGLVWISNQYEFASRVVLPLRIVLFVSLAVAVSLALAWPLSRLNRRRTTRLAEEKVPGFEQRLLTLTERPDPTNPFTELVAEDALQLARENEPERLSPWRRLAIFAGSGAAAAAVLMWLIAAGPGYWGYGASLLWTGNGNVAKRPLYDISVKPGNATIRRRADQHIHVQLMGFSAHSVKLYAKYGSALKWDEAVMQPGSDGSGYQFLFAGLSEPVEYYVQADSALSKHFTINVKDLPAVKRVKVALHYPAGLGLRDEVQDPGGDLRVVEGTKADVSILTDRPLERGEIVLEDGNKLPLAHSDGQWLTAKLNVQKDGSYHVAALDGGDTVRISDDYFIEAKKDEAPTVKISRPGHDAHVSPIEELPVTVEAADDFALEDLELHYSVNGGDEKTVPLLKQKGVKEASGSHLMALEDLSLLPGDLVSFYATAKDASKTSHSEILFATAEPFDFKFSQSQQMGGGGGGMGGAQQDSDISERQKQIIAATFNQVGGAKSGPVIGGVAGAGAPIAKNARFLSDAEGKLSEQAKTLAERMGNRELGQAGAEFQNFSKLMTQASGQMTEAAGHLKPGKWHDALPPEQKALQSLLRAEALFRDIQVAFGQQAGGGGGMGAQRDLARMFDLELDTSKNQYETGQSKDSGGSNDQQKAIDDAFQKLEALARRQQELAAQNQTQQAFEQRWQEEQLRREAEELRQQMQQLAQNQQDQQGQQQQSSQSQSGQSSSSSSAQSSQSGSSGSQSSRANSRMQNAHNSQQEQQRERQNAEAMQRAANSLQRAEEEMRKAVSERDATAQQRASADLREAEETLRNMLHDQAGSSVSDLAKKAQEIANEQRDLAERMKQMYGNGSPLSRGRNGFEQQANTGGGEDPMPEMNDPNSSRYGWGFRRRNWQPPQMARSATDQEKAVAADKEKLAAQLQQLQTQMQKEAESLAGTQPGASTKMRKALSDAEQKELALRMQKDAEWMRQGYGDRNVGMEDNVTAGLDDLSRQLRDLQEALKAGEASGKAGQNDKAAEALSELRDLREQLQQRQSEQLQRGDSGQPNQQAKGQQAQNGSQRGSEGAWSQRGGPGDELDRQGVQQAIGQLNWLRTQVNPRDRELGGYIDGAIWNLHHLTGAQAGLLDARINQDAVASLQRLEVELSKRVAQSQVQGARTGAPEPAPEKYRDAVSEYFKKLSQP